MLAVSRVALQELSPCGAAAGGEKEVGTLIRQERVEAELTKLITEKDFMAQVVALAQTLGWRVWHCHDSRRSAAGFP